MTSIALAGAAALLAGCTTRNPAPAATVTSTAAEPAAMPPLTPPAVAPARAEAAAPPAAMATCDVPAFAAAARANAQSLNTSPWMFSAGTREKPEGPGWAAYVPIIAHTLGTACGPATAGFAQALSDWQSQRGLAANGMMSRDTAAKMKEGWQARRAHLARPCVELSRTRTAAIPSEARFDASDRRLQTDALAAYHRLLAAARREQPALFLTPTIMQAASAWRDPADDRTSCTRNPGPCNGTAKAVGCSAHWSGWALDLNLGFLPGRDPTDSTYANRLHQSRNPAYVWMLENAGRFGFVNYYYEPWHWEWQGNSVAGPSVGNAG